MVYLILMFVSVIFIVIHVACLIISIKIDKNKEISANRKLIKRFFSILLLSLSVIIFICLLALLIVGLKTFDTETTEMVINFFIACPIVSSVFSIVGSGILFA